MIRDRTNILVQIEISNLAFTRDKIKKLYNERTNIPESALFYDKLESSSLRNQRSMIGKHTNIVF